jgi:hypothetical protein
MMVWSVLFFQYFLSATMPQLFELDRPHYIEFKEYLTKHYFLLSQLLIVLATTFIYLVYYLKELEDFAKYFSKKNCVSIQNYNRANQAYIPNDVCKFACLCQTCSQNVTD